MGTVAVIGGTGFLGRHVTRALEAAGHEVRPFSRRTGHDALRPGPDLLRGCDAVVNLAGIKREEGNQTFHAVHVELVERLIAGMKTAGISRLIHVSVVVAREGPALPYNHTKWLGEEAVRRSGLDWTILRPGVIYGEGDDLLSHLTLMIRSSPVFPVVNDGSAPMMPVDARDVAAAVAASLGSSDSRGRTYDVVGPERLRLRDVVTRVAEATGLPVSIRGTPVALMRLPVALMEATMRRPLSTRAQLAMLIEGLAGDPEPARRDLGLSPAPFTPERLRPLVEKIEHRAPFTLRLFSAPRPRRETSASAAVILCLLAAALFTLALAPDGDRWMGMILTTGTLLAGCLMLPSVRRRLRPTPFGLLAGALAGGVLIGLTTAGLPILRAAWPGWEAYARDLLSWRGSHPTPFLLSTLVMIVVAEEALWRGVVARFCMERTGRAAGIVIAAILYAAAHLVTLNPLLLGVALVMGVAWGWLYAATDDLVAPTVCHLAWDLMMIFVAPPLAPAGTGC